MTGRKKGLGLLALALGTVVLFTAYAILSALNRASVDNPPGEQTPALKATALEPERITGIAVTTPGGEPMGFEKQEDSWRSVQMPNLPLNQELIASMARTIADVTAARVLIDANPSDYGFDEPQLNVTVTLDDQSAQEFQFGAFNTVTSQYYFKAADSGDIYTVSYSVCTPFMNQLFNLAQIDALPALETTSVYALTYREGDQTHIVRYFANGRDDAYTPLFRWFYSAGSGFVPADDEQVKGIIESFTALSFSACVWYEPDASKLAEFGLDQPRVITAEYNEGERVTLLVGATEGTATYVMLEGSQMVCRIGSTAKVANLGDYFADIGTPLVAAVSQYTLTQVDITQDGRTDTLTLDNIDETYTLGGSPVEAQAVTDLFAALLGLTSDQAADAPVESALTLDFHSTRSGFERLTLTVGKTGDAYAATFLGRTRVIAQSAYDALLAAISALSA